MIVEFYGLPGSGKTTIARALEKGSGKYVYLHTSLRSEIVKLVPLFAFQNPKKALFWFGELFRESAKFHFRTLFRYKLHLLLISIAQYQKARRGGGAIYLLDEGLLQRVLSIYETKKTKDEIIRCVRQIPRTDKIVITENSPTEFYRFKCSPHRHESPRLKLGREYLENWMDVVRHNDALIKAVLKEFGENIVICNRPSGIDECTKTIEQ